MIIEAGEPSFKNALLFVQMFEYDPLLADRAADLVDTATIADLGHDAGAESRYAFTIGKEKKIRPNRNYYIVAIICKDAAKLDYPNRLYYGLPTHTTGICKVLTNGEPTQVTFKGKKVDG
jgi:hypothetical protein